MAAEASSALASPSSPRSISWEGYCSWEDEKVNGLRPCKDREYKESREKALSARSFAMTTSPWSPPSGTRAGDVLPA